MVGLGIGVHELAGSVKIVLIYQQQNCTFTAFLLSV
jgi:hypothetical protein